jgi:protein arginine kinase
MAQPKFIQTIVTSTRIRLARNLSAYPFPDKLDKKLASEIVYLVGEELGKIDDFEKYDMRRFDKNQATLLQEQHLISPALIRKKGTAFVTPDKSVSIMVNEEDHLRQQYIYKGFDLYKAYERISGIDDGLGASLDFAYNEKLGYLTACPSNLGTGMRASVMMFLPGLERTGELKELIRTLKAGGLAVRGVFGEGTTAEGYSYQISNERTLGLSEKEILEQMVITTMNLCDLEIRAREEMLKVEKIPLKDACLRAYGTITNCMVLTEKELTESMVKVRLGMALGFFKTTDIRGFNDFLADMRPASFRLENGLQTATDYECNLMRAEIVQKVLPELVQRID